ncbi:BrxA/BrxB family bacilliredoxin [Granulicella sp. S156]|uniref:BrxA/BrxB family bacilliredoxin n=1 Tax=Granulicella sp. S156 TaxID=1747224 RepID=UPI00131D9A84|nr:BrxA/BrxB family bacilliredoxin [Granulicella sp. S156]
MPYSPLLVKPFRDEVVEAGVKDLQTSADVDTFFANQKGLSLLFINSVCGCAAGTARPALRIALANDKKPDQSVSVFAGQDLEATAKARNYFPDIPPSSPSFAFFKDGELVYFIPKHRIESRDANSVAQDLISVFQEFA